MNMKQKLQHTVLAICVSDLLLLTACVGGGGGVVRKELPQSVAPPAGTSFNPAAICPEPVTTDCVVVTPPSTSYDMAERQSTHALILRAPDAQLGLVEDNYRFDGGTNVEQGWLGVGASKNASSSLTTLKSNVTVAAPAALVIVGTVDGDVSNLGNTTLFGTISGNVASGGRFIVFGDVYDTQLARRIGGNFDQATTGTFVVALGPAGATYQGWLNVGGRADLDGTLELSAYSDAWESYPLPAATSHLLLHADGGVFGQFAQWTSPGLFIEGSPRYGSHDVWFDLSRISVQTMMGTQGADAMTLASAAQVDSALASADAFAVRDDLTSHQRHFLASASFLLHAQDTAQAGRILDSLYGHAHALALDVLREQTTASAAQLDARLDRVPRGARAAWSSSLAHAGYAGDSYTIEGHTGGYDQWLNPQWLVGGSVTSGRSRMQFERMGGNGQGESPVASVHAHYRGDRWHATGLVGAGRTSLQLERPIDLGAAGMHLAHSRRGVDQAFVHGELGRRIDIGRSRLTPFVAIDYSALHSDGFVEQGDTGFELVAQPARNAQLSVAVGTRYTHDWRTGQNGWLRLDLDARYQHSNDGNALRAAFIGTPDAWFDLAPWLQPADTGLVRMGLAGGFDERWNWSLDYARQSGTDARTSGWSFTMRRGF
jgi:hypothetical protein